VDLLLENVPVTRPNTVRNGIMNVYISFIICNVICIVEYFALGVTMLPLLPLILNHLLVVLQVGVIAVCSKRFSIIILKYSN